MTGDNDDKRNQIDKVKDKNIVLMSQMHGNNNNNNESLDEMLDKLN